MLRAIDANINRACEALRVLEDISRFNFNNKALSEDLKSMRHVLRQATPAAAIAERDTPGDVGTAISTEDEMQRSGLAALISANAKRVQEALRVIEESAKLPSTSALHALPFEQLRYQIYGHEKTLMQCLPAARLWQEKLYVLIDDNGSYDVLAFAQQLAKADVGLIQYRAKQLNESAYYEQAARIKETLNDEQLFMVNDYVAVAAAIEADGVHVGQDDAMPMMARSVLGPLAVIGLSTHSAEQINAAHKEPIDYIGMGPMFATQTKAHEPVRGPELLESADISLPSYAIGGLDFARAQELQSKIPHGIAVASCIAKADDPIASINAFQALLRD